MFPGVAIPQPTRIPDQRALLAWSNGVETLVIETRFSGAGTNFAWVVPLPSVPRIEAATTGLFPTLEHLFRPTVIHDPAPVFGLTLSATALFWLLLTLRRTGFLPWSDWVAAISLGGGLVLASTKEPGVLVFGLMLSAVGIYVAWRVRLGQESKWMLLASALLLFVLAGMLLPALSTAGAGAAGTDGVDVIDRRTVGLFDTTTVAAREPGALVEWLARNGYYIPTNAEPAVRQYVGEGWVFVASRVRLDAPAATPQTLHPLRFVFDAREPVYPMRLTGAGNDTLDVDLYVFGPEQAGAEGFQVIESGPTKDSPGKEPRWWASIRPIPLAHEDLRRSVSRAPWATRLRGRLAGAAMHRDAVIHWGGTESRREELYSHRGALLAALNRGGTGFCVWLVCVAVVCSARGGNPSRFRRLVGVGGVAGAAVVAAFFIRLPKIPVTVESRYARWLEAQNQVWSLEIAIGDDIPKYTPTTVKSVRATIQRNFPKTMREWRAKPRLPIREEDSPFNYTLRPSDAGVDVLLHDARGHGNVVCRFGPRGPADGP